MLAKGQLYLSPLATKNRVDNGGGELDASQSPLELQLPWPTAGDQFVASYTNVRGKAYSTLCSMNENHFFEKNKFPDLIPTIDEWSLQAMIQEYRRKF